MALFSYKKIRSRINWKVKKTDEKKMSFFRSIFISYGLAIVMSVFSLLIDYENLNAGCCNFENCKNAPWALYILFIITQSLITTTIPFASTTLSLQSEDKKHKSVKTIVTTLISVLAMFYVTQTFLISIPILCVTSIVALIFIVITIYCCWIMFCVPNENFRAIKKEPSDGKPIT